MTSRLSKALLFGTLGTFGILAWSGCASSKSGTGTYCAPDGCYSCDAYGCSDVRAPSSEAADGACTSDGECTSPDAPKCAAGTCVKACALDDECGEGNYCSEGACVADTRPKPNCTTDEQCGGTAETPKKCLAGFCKFTCTTDAYCRTIDNRIGYCAKDGVCRTAAEANASCLGSDDCAPGQQCVDNVCK